LEFKLGAHLRNIFITIKYISYTQEKPRGDKILFFFSNENFRFYCKLIHRRFNKQKKIERTVSDVLLNITTDNLRSLINNGLTWFKCVYGD